MIRLGLDLGVSSIGWAVVNESKDQKDIVAMGSRIIPLTSDDEKEFSQGQSISKNQSRTLKRTQRKGYDRYQLRRKALVDILRRNGMLPDANLIGLQRNSLWELRSNAATQRVELMELGRVLLLINQKRGYKSGRSEANLDKKDTEYVSEIKSRHELLKEQGKTIGQHLYSEMLANEFFRVKDTIYPREAYIEEFDTICRMQQQYHPSTLTNELIDRIRNEVIFYQRKLKSQKGLVSTCEFEGFWTKKEADGKSYFVGPKVAHRSSPLSQLCKIWENTNNITITSTSNSKLQLTIEQKRAIAAYLDSNEKLTAAELFKILGLRKSDGWCVNKQIERGIVGNTTKSQLAKILGKEYEHLLEFTPRIDDSSKATYVVSESTGEITDENTAKVINADIEFAPLYKLWHLIYSISDIDECAKAIVKTFGLPDDTALKLAQIDFTRQAYGNKSVKAMRKILPYLMEGYVYSEACSLAGYNHSNSITKEENLKRELLDKLPLLDKNSLRQPIVEKILNQMVNLVNAIIDRYGKPDTIVIELARELKQSRDERNDTYSYQSKRDRENKIIENTLENEFQLRATRNNIIKYRLYKEISGEESKCPAVCIYCGKPISFSAAMNGEEVDIEHIIPKSLIFDDSQSNKTLAHRRCNSTKNNQTAYDFMKNKSEAEFNEYIERVQMLYSSKLIGKGKRDKLLMPADKIPSNFIDRQLRESQYIAKKSYELLQKICRNVYATGGGVTEFLRRTWGWDDVLMNLQLPKYRELGLTKIVDFENNHQLHKKEIIEDWSKRLDHRHHAIDALVIACTDKAFIQRINTLSSDKTRKVLYEEVEGMSFESSIKRSLLEKYLLAKRSFSTSQVMEQADKILVSFKAGKRVATVTSRKIKVKGAKKVVQKGIIVPRGPLSEESVYGSIMTLDRKQPLKYLLENPHLIFNAKVKQLVEERLQAYDGDEKKAKASLKKEPILLDKEKGVELEYGSCFKPEYVMKYKLKDIDSKKVDRIIDGRVREIVANRLKEHGNNAKEAYKTPLWFNEAKGIEIKSVRCATGLSAVVPVRYNADNEGEAFVKPGNNQHVAIYTDEQGKFQEHVCTFWHAVERKKYQLPVVIEHPEEVWSKVLASPDTYPQSFIDQLPKDGWAFVQSIQQNEMVVLGMPEEEYALAIESNDTALLSKYLYRVQKLTSKDYFFRHHLETQLDDSENAKKSLRFISIRSLKSFFEKNPHKVRINNLGEIVNQSELQPLMKADIMVKQSQ